MQFMVPFTRTAKVALRAANEGCHLLKTEEECLGSKDGRDFYHDNPCHWCCGNSCIYQGNKCKPSKFIASRQTTFKILSRNGLGFHSCTATGGDCTVCLVAVMSHLLDKKRIHSRMHGHFVHTHIVIPPSSFATYCQGGVCMYVCMYRYMLSQLVCMHEVGVHVDDNNTQYRHHIAYTFTPYL